MDARGGIRHLVTRSGALALCFAACAPTQRSSGDADGDDISGGFIDATPFLDGGSGGEECNKLKATVRDFHRTHPDFETFTGDYVKKGIVQDQIGPDRKPVYALPGASDMTSGPAQFVQWYNDVPGVNLAIPIELTLTPTSDGRYVYDSAAFFPIDGEGFGDEGFNHNFHFTTEIHTSFTYKGGEFFTFRGDDDLWLFINGRLVIDLGGVHSPATQSVMLDERAADIGIEVGKTYPMDIFHAERHTVQSNFHLETTIDCLIVE